MFRIYTNNFKKMEEVEYDVVSTEAEARTICAELELYGYSCGFEEVEAQS